MYLRGSVMMLMATYVCNIMNYKKELVPVVFIAI